MGEGEGGGGQNSDHLVPPSPQSPPAVGGEVLSLRQGVRGMCRRG
jgi:hypothetical protein